MLTHGNYWDNVGWNLSKYITEKSKKLSRWLCNWIPSIDKVIQCTKNKLILIEFGNLAII